MRRAKGGRGGSRLLTDQHRCANRSAIWINCPFAKRAKPGMFSSRLMKELAIQDLHVAIGDQEIVRGLSLTLPRGEVHAIMGPNGSGKSTLAKVLAGHPDYHVTKGKVLMDGENVLDWAPDERARKGLFLAFQYPSEIPGVTIANFLRAAVQARLPEGEELEATDYYAKLYEKMELLGDGPLLHFALRQ